MPLCLYSQVPTRMEIPFDANANEPVPGLMNIELGGYHVRDVEIPAAFDVSVVRSPELDALAPMVQHTTVSTLPA